MQRYNVYLAELGLALWAVEFFFRRNDETRRFLVGFCGPKKVAVWKGNGYFNKNESRLLKYRNFARGFWSHYRNCCDQRWWHQLAVGHNFIFSKNKSQLKQKNPLLGPILAINSSADLRICYQLPMFHGFCESEMSEDELQMYEQYFPLPYNYTSIWGLNILLKRNRWISLEGWMRAISNLQRSVTCMFFLCFLNERIPL